MDYLAPIGDELLEEDRSQNRGAPDGQRCQLLIDHDPPHMASIRGIVRGWTDDGEAEHRRGRSAGRRPSHATRRRKEKPDPRRPATA
jgi:hypothetical protein